ncbi:MAG TPA: transglycosylase domain-containing protein [Solirubrobacteraceae bacterium]|jgi:penicillin-binding protein 1A
MTESELNGHSSVATFERGSNLPPPPSRRRRGRRRIFGRRAKRYNRHIRWWRIIAIALPLSFLAVVSFAFGVVVAFAPQIAPLVRTLKQTYTNGANSIIYSSNGTRLATLTNHDQFFLTPNNVPLDSLIAHAVVAVEDKRFYTEPAIDFRGMARALVVDVLGGGGTQGGSTITEQFVKTALNEGAPSKRTLIEKLKEAGIAFQLSHLWHKDQILTQYLNTTFFGVATGVEAAAQAWFGFDPNSTLYGCGQNPSNGDPASLCVTGLNADQAALLAGIIDEPSNYVTWLTTDPQRVYNRRNLVLRLMMEQGYLTPAEYSADVLVSLPDPMYVETPSQEGTQPSTGYFANWIRQQLLANPKFSNLVYGGGLRVHTTLDYQLQKDAMNAVTHYLPANSGGPSAALVAIDNSTGYVRAMIGGYDYNTHAFNLATQAERQPGSAFKVFDLAAALEANYTRTTTVLSAPFHYNAPAPFYPFTFHNDERTYYGVKIPLWQALAVSDNSVFARLSLEYPGMGTSTIAKLAKSFGITTGISINPSMVIGGLNQGVTPLDMAHAYETIAQGGDLISGTLASDECAGGDKSILQPNAPTPGSHDCPGPVGIRFVAQGTKQDTTVTKNYPRTYPTYFPASDDAAEISMLRGVLSPIGTAAGAAIPGVAAWGKTGTTSNYTDAWFVGSTPVIHTAHGDIPSMTVAVWVGYPNRESRSMAKDYGGKPVYGGTYPALIWRNYMMAAIATRELENEGQFASPGHSPSSKTGSTGSTGSVATTSPNNAAQTGTTSSGGTSANGGAAVSTPTQNNNAPATGTTSAGGTAGGTTQQSTPPPTTSPPPGTSPGGGVTAPSGGAIGPTGG